MIQDIPDDMKTDDVDLEAALDSIEFQMNRIRDTIITIRRAIDDDSRVAELDEVSPGLREECL